MAAPHAARLFAAALAGFGGACATGPSSAFEVGYERHVDLPPAVATAIAAGALRHALPFADPVPQARGAPATELDRGEFEVRYEQGRTLAWVPCASHRLAVVPFARGNAVEVRIEELRCAQRLPAFGRHAVASIHLHITAEGGGCRVAGAFATELGPSLALALDRAFELAEDPTACVLGLAEPNLAAVVCNHLLAQATEALAARRPLEARAALQRIERLGWASTAMQGRLGDLAAAAGDHASAREHLLHAMIGAADPTARRHLAGRLAAVSAAAGDCGALRAAARERFADDDLAAAAALLHTARRERPDPIADYKMASQLHQQRHDPGTALAYALLAREYGTTPPLPRVAGKPRGLTEPSRPVPADRHREPATSSQKPRYPKHLGTAPPR